MFTPKKTWSAGLVGLVLAMAAPASAEEVTAKTVVATVGGTEITLGHMAAARSSLPEQYQQVDPAMLYDGLLDQLIHQTALAQSLGDDVSAYTRALIDNQTSGLIAAEALSDAMERAVTEEAIQAAYDAQFKDAEQETEYNAAHILVETEEEAKAIVEELGGGADFATIAQEKSTGPSGPNGGALGWFGTGMMVPEFEAAVVALEPGKVSEPVQTQFGWHVILLNESRLIDAPTLDEVRAQLVEQVQSALIDEVMSEVLSRTEVVKADVTVDPTALVDPELFDR